MTLYEFITMEHTDFDTYDTEFDICVSVHFYAFLLHDGVKSSGYL